MDFSWTPELLALADEAREVGRKAAEGRWLHEDSWIAQTDREFAKELAARGWLGMTWPTEWGGGGRSALERFVVFEELITEGAPIAGSWFADRQMGPTLLQFGTDEQRQQVAARHHRRRVDVVHRHVRARRRLRRRLAAHQRGPRRRRLGRQRPEDLDLGRRRSPSGATSSPAPTPTRPSTRACPSSSST